MKATFTGPSVDVIVPLCIIVPLAATRLVMPSSSKMSSQFTTCRIISETFSVGMRTVPGTEFSGGVVISKFIRFLPSKLTVKCSAAPTCTVPRFATISPSSETSGATITAYPLSAITISPLLMIEASSLY